MDISIHLSPGVRKVLTERLHHAYRTRQVRLMRRVHALLYLADGYAVGQIADQCQH